jgi:hypothetical protein
VPAQLILEREIVKPATTAMVITSCITLGCRAVQVPTPIRVADTVRQSSAIPATA